MPVPKDKCVCQICVCGQHHCGDEPIIFLKDHQNLEHSANTCLYHQEQAQTTGQDQNQENQQIINDNQQQSLIRFNLDDYDELIEPSTQQLITTRFIRRPKRSAATVTTRKKTKSNKQTKMKEQNLSNTEPENLEQNQPTLETNQTESNNCKTGEIGTTFGTNECILGLDEADFQNNPNNQQQQQRKTWKTSPEQVEELTRSLSRMRNDEHGNTRVVEKTVEKSKMTKSGPSVSGTNKNATISKSSNKTTGKQSKTTKRPTIAMDQFTMPNSNVKTVQSTSKLYNSAGQPINGGLVHHQIVLAHHPPPQQQSAPSFLPPLTGFSDTDSSFSSIVCSSEDCDKIHCICETLKKTHLEHHQFDDRHHPQRSVVSDNGINYINLDDDYHDHDLGVNHQWVVMRPKRSRPRDNLKLEGQMELETTFRSTYGGLGSHKSSKRSSGSNSGSKQSFSPTQLYCNTRRGRNSGQTPIVRSATKRKTIRNRPRTSLKTGGHGYWSTNNRDAYKNFIIINGEAKTVSDNYRAQQQQQTTKSTVKLPKVVAKSTTMTTEEKNRCKYDVNQTIGDDLGDGKPLQMLDGAEIKKIEKKQYFTTEDGAGELMAEKLVKKVRHGGPSAVCSKKSIKEPEDQLEREGKPLDANDMMEPKKSDQTRSYDAYYDHIKDLGLLEMKSQMGEEEQNLRYNENYRPHLRRLHEKSDDFILHDVNGNGKPQLKQPPKIKTSKTLAMEKPETTKSSLVVNGHAVMAATKQPFLLPQRIQRHKNESTINQMFDADLEWTTTSKSSYQNGRITSGQRKRTAGKRTQRSGRRRNLFRQSSDSIFARPDSSEKHQPPKQPEVVDKNEKSSYKTEFGDQSLHCPALDLNQCYRKTTETGGHHYYNKI